MDYKSICKKFNLINLQGANLKEANLQEANLQGADLRKANLWRANLERADLRKADLQGANLRGANLRGANHQGANLEGVNLWGADLKGADLIGTNLWRADLKGANLSNVKGLLDPLEYLHKNFEWTNEGIIVYKSFGTCFQSPLKWKIKPGSIIEEKGVNCTRTYSCGSGINVSTLEWLQLHSKSNKVIWKCLIQFEWFLYIIVPYNTDGKIRVGKLQLINKL